MGKKEKKQQPEEKKPDEAEKPAAGEEQEKVEATKAEKKKSEEQPPPQEIVLKVFMHCEGCARKVRRCLKGFDGVEDVITDCRSSKVVVKGEKADPLKVLERVQKKSHGQVELVYPIPKPPAAADEPKKPEEVPKEVPKNDEEKKEEPQAITVVLGVYMHCEACAQEIKRRIQRMKGVENAEPDLKSSQVKVKGVFEPEKLVDYVHRRTGKHAMIVKVEPEKKEEEKSKDSKEEKKPEEVKKDAKKDKKPAKENKEETGGGEPPAKAEAEMVDPKLELRKNEYFYHYHPQNIQLYPPRYVQEMHAYPPQMFSDENPNACSVM